MSYLVRRLCGQDILGDDGVGQHSGTTAMAKKPGTNPKGEFVFFDVVYEDGTQRSNRKVPREILGGLDKDEPARGFIIEQDRDIAQKRGFPASPIKLIYRSGEKPEKIEKARKRAV